MWICLPAADSRSRGEPPAGDSAGMGAVTLPGMKYRPAQMTVMIWSAKLRACQGVELGDVGMGERREVSLAEERYEITLDDADIVVEHPLAAARIELGSHFSHAGSRHVVEALYDGCKPEAFSESCFVVELAGDAGSVVQLCLAGAEAMPAAREQLVAAVPVAAASDAVENEFAVSELLDARLCCCQRVDGAGSAWCSRALHSDRAGTWGQGG